MLQVALKSFSDFLVVRTVSNKYSFRKKVKAEIVHAQQLFVRELLLVFDSESIQQLE
jgi:hypothetical protein